MRRLLMASLVAVAAGACGGGIDTSADWDPATDFSQYSSYAWVAGAQSTGFGDLADSRVKAAIEADLQAKGLKPAARGADADLGVGFQVTTRDRTSFQTVNSGWPGGYYGGYGYGGWGGGTSTTYASTYTDGSLIIGLFDLASKKMVWQGVGTKTLETNKSPEDRTRSINESVTKIMAGFPPR